MTGIFGVSGRKAWARAVMMGGMMVMAAACPFAWAEAEAPPDTEASALMLADQTAVVVQKPQDWRVFLELAAGGVSGVNGTGAAAGLSDQTNQRFSFDMQVDTTLSPGLRGIFSDRLDMNWAQPVATSPDSSQNGINTLREAYLSWQSTPNGILDAGRINTRYGVGSGYNPTDYFRADSVRSQVSVDPASLRENRQGSVMLRGQVLWDTGSITAIFSPRLATASPDPAATTAFSPDWGATNHQQRMLVAVTQKMADGLSPQWLLFKQEAQPVQVGFNLTGLVNDATVAYVEWSGGRSLSLLQQANASMNAGINGGTNAGTNAGVNAGIGAGGSPFALPQQQTGVAVYRQRMTTGLTYTTSGKLSLTAELAYNGGGLDSAGWTVLGHGSPLVYANYRQWLQRNGESPTRYSAMVYATWQDAMLNHLDITAMQRLDLIDSSRLLWLEARYHVDGSDIALQWQRNSGGGYSDYGVAGAMQRWQVLLRRYF